MFLLFRLTVVWLIKHQRQSSTAAVAGGIFKRQLPLAWREQFSAQLHLEQTTWIIARISTSARTAWTATTTLGQPKDAG